jgi:hypothetical protein
MNTSSSEFPILVEYRNLQEAEVAITAVRAFRAGGQVPAQSAGVDPETARADRMETALRAAPMNRPKEIVLQILFDASPKAWVKFSDMQAAFRKERIQPERASAAIRDLSTLMGQLPPEDISGLARKIEVLAERSRVGGEYRYRLTRAGRIAAGRVLTP